MIPGVDSQEYIIQVAGQPLRILGPKDPTALLDDPDVLQRNRRDDYMPYWATPWPAAVMLAEYLLGLPGTIAEPILEIGAGLGIVGIALARAGYQVVVTDYDDDSLAYIQASARVNAVSLQKVIRLDWRQPPPPRFPTVVAADVLYETRNQLPVSRLIAARLEPDGRAYVCDPNRMAAKGFAAVLGEQGLECETFPVSVKPEQALKVVSPDLLKGTVFEIHGRC